MAALSHGWVWKSPGRGCKTDSQQTKAPCPTDGLGTCIRMTKINSKSKATTQIPRQGQGQMNNCLLEKRTEELEEESFNNKCGCLFRKENIELSSWTGKKKWRSHQLAMVTCGLFTHFINNDCKWNFWLSLLWQKSVVFLIFNEGRWFSKLIDSSRNTDFLGIMFI